MKKRLLSTFMVLAMVLTMLPTVAFAEDYTEKNLSSGSITLSSAGNYKISQTSTETATSNTITVTATGVNITLDGVNMASYSPITINSGCSTTITVNGENTVTSTGTTYSYGGIKSNGDLTINGDGTLNVSGFQGIYMAAGTLTIDGAVNVNASGSNTSGSSVIKHGTGIYYYNAGGNITISSSGTLTASGYRGIYYGKTSDMTISITKGTSNITGVYSAIFALNGNLDISGDAVVNATSSSSTYGVYCASYTQSDEAKVTMDSCRLNVTGAINQTGGELTVNNTDNYGITGANITIEDAKLTIKSDWAGIYSSTSGTTVTLKGSVVDITTSETGTVYHGIFLDYVSITGDSKINIDVANGSGIYGSKSLTIDDTAEVFIKSCNYDALDYGSSATTSIKNIMMLNFNNTLAYDSVVLTPTEGDVITYSGLEGYDSIAFTGPESATDYTIKVNGTYQASSNSITFTSDPTALKSYNYVKDATITYSLNTDEDTITAKVGTTELGTLLLEVPTGTLIYDGTTEYPATVTPTTWIGDVPTITYTKDEVAFEGTPTEAGEYVASITVDTVTASVEFTIAQSAVTSTGLSVNDATPTYGDTVTFTVTPTATGESVSDTPVVMSRAAVAPTSGQMALYATIDGVETLLCDGVDADGDGKYTMTYDTTDKLLAVGTHTITAKYVATANMTDYSVTTSITISAKEVTAEAVETGITKAYDGTDAVKVDGTIADITFTVPVVTDSGDVVTVTADAAYDDVDVDTDIAINFTNQVDDGADKAFYDVSLPDDVTGNITALSVTETGLTGTATVVEGNVVFAEPSFDGVTVDEVTEAVPGSVAYRYNSVDYADYTTLITALNLLNYEEDTDINVTYTFTADGNYTGTKTGTLTLTVTVVEPVYTASGSTITATYDGDMAGTVSISAPTSTAVYDGSTAADVSIVKTGIFADEDITITYTKDGVAYDDTLDQAGNYVATITYGGETATASFSISKAPVSFSVTGTSIDADDYTAPTITSTPVLTLDTDYTVAYLDETGEVVDDLSAADVGTYTIQVTVTNDNYYLSGTVGTVVIWEETEPDKYDLTFENNGVNEVTGVTDVTDVIAGTVHTLPTPPNLATPSQAGAMTARFMPLVLSSYSPKMMSL